MNRQIAIVIPARFSSTRFPGKPLVPLGSKPMIEYVYRGCRESKHKPLIFIATDDERIFKTCKSFIQGEDRVVMTPREINTGTERVAWVAREIPADYIINIQGDEPLITGSVVDMLIEETYLCDERTPVSTLVCRCTDDKEFTRPNTVKVVLSNERKALYFSRSAIPGSKSSGDREFFKHIGLYGFKRDFLLRFKDLKPGYLEKMESLEQLRILENSYGIRVGIVEDDLIGVDSKDAISVVESMLKAKGRLLV